MNQKIDPEWHRKRGTKPSHYVPEPAKDKAGKPKMPAYLSKEARKEWKRVLPLLEARGSVTEADAMALTVYCEAVSRYVAALKSLERDGITVTTVVLDSNGQAHKSAKPNHSLKVAETCERTIRAFLREFGCTPLTRERIKPAAEPEADEGSGLLALLRKGNK